MRRSCLLPATLLLTTILAACGDESATAPDPPRTLTAVEQAVIQGDNTFGLRLFRELNTDAGDSSVFVSPLSVSMALGMTLNGAGGATAASMRQTLELNGLTSDQINLAFRTIIDLLRSLDPKVQFEIANSIWHRPELNVEPSFINVNRQYFDAEVVALDFDSPDALGRINGWVSEKTHGRIEKIIDQIPPYIAMYLIDAIYFKAPWTIEFSKDSTRRMDFRRPGGQLEQVSMMFRSGTFRYFEDALLRAVDLPYGNGRYSMLIMLPNDARGATMDQLVAQLTPETWSTIVDGLDSAVCQIYLPRFRLEYSCRLDDALKRMGMGNAFTAAADFSGIARNQSLNIGEVRHKTFVEVDEAGTEAAAVTSVGMGWGMMEIMMMDRPFLIAIRENVSGSIIFVGKIAGIGS